MTTGSVSVAGYDIETNLRDVSVYSAIIIMHVCESLFINACMSENLKHNFCL